MDVDRLVDLDEQVDVDKPMDKQVDNPVDVDKLTRIPLMWTSHWICKSQQTSPWTWTWSSWRTSTWM
jgi:hypothetical protein